MRKLKKFFIFCMIIVFAIVGSASQVSADDADEDDFVFTMANEASVAPSSSSGEVKDEKNSVGAATAASAGEKKGEPKLNARYCAVFDRNSDRVIWGKNADKETAMASTTKIMTAIVVLENTSNLEKEISVSKKAAGTGGSRLKLAAGDKITINDLLFGLLLRSGNDAAIALAEAVGGSVENFVKMMNNKAKQLDLRHTHFVTPHGLDDPQHFTTPSELAKIAHYALKNATFANIVKSKFAVIKVNGVPRELKNTNELLCADFEGVYGVKTGFTNNAGRCLVTAIKHNNMDLIIVVLGADTRKDRARDTVNLYNFVKDNFKEVDVAERVESEFDIWREVNQSRIDVHKGNAKLSTKLGNYKLKKILTDKEISVKVESINSLEAPVEKNSKVGELTVMNGKDVLEKVDILVKYEVRRKGVKDYFSMLLRNFAA